MKNKVYSDINNNIIKLLALSLIMGILFCSFTSNAGDKDMGPDIFYKSHTIQLGDTLWSLSSGASDNMDINTKDMLKLIMEINDLDNDCICIGDVLIIPYAK